MLCNALQENLDFIFILLNNMKNEVKVFQLNLINYLIHYNLYNHIQ